MKKNIITCIALASIVLACKKENAEVVVPTETPFQKNLRVLTAANWKLDSLYIKNAGKLVNSGIPDSCLLDDIYSFNKNGLYITQNGTNNCFEEEMPADTLKWEQTTGGDTLILKGITFPYSVKYKINSLNDSKFVIYNQDGFTEEIRVYKK
jgi:hypothetical protein